LPAAWINAWVATIESKAKLNRLFFSLDNENQLH